MLGSHNSLSYLPIKGWRKILKPWVKCQSKTIEEQYNSGVRYFDLRVRRVEGKGWWYCHNNAVFVPVMEHKEILEFLLEKDAYIRIILDVRKKPKNAATYKSYFLDLIEWYIRKGLKVDSAIVYWDWKDLIARRVIQCEYHSSVSAPWYKYILGTKWFAKHYNKSYLKENEPKVLSEDDVILMDYV